MRILIDECVNPRVKAAFANHEVKTVVEMGWGGITNGELLARAEQSFDALVTIDRNIEHQQNTSQRKLGFVVIKVPDNKIASYAPIFADMCDAAERVQPGEVIHIDGSTPPRRR